MGACSVYKKDNYNFSMKIPKAGSRLIMCNIEYEKEIIKFNFTSQTYVKEIKFLLKKQILKNKIDDQLIKLFYNGKELKQENECLENFIQEDEVNIIMVALSSTDDIPEDYKKFNEILIKSYNRYCDIHKDEKAILLCINCEVSLCSFCQKHHLNHEIINKNSLLEIEENLKLNYSTVNTSLSEIGFNSNDGDFYKNYRCDLTSQIDVTVESVDRIKKLHNKIMNDFKMNLENILPSLFDYKDKLNNLTRILGDSKREKLLKDDKYFVEFYNKYLNTLKQNDKAKDNINLLKFKLSQYKLLFDDFKKRIDEIMKNIDDHFEKIKDYEIAEYDINNKMLINHELNKGKDAPNSPNYEIRSFNTLNSPGKINLFNLMTSPNNGKDIIKNFELLNKKEKLYKSFNNLKTNPKNLKFNTIIFESMEITNNSNNLNQLNNINQVQVDTIPKLKHLANLEVSTKNIFLYDVDEKILIKKEANLMSVANLKKFEVYHSTLNYKNRFFISGGYSTSSKMWAEYNFNSNEFIKLKDMLHGFSYHGLIGVNNYIFSISGFNSKKVDKYSLDFDNWNNLPDLNCFRTWPCSLILDNSQIFVFGGITEPEKKGSKMFEKFDLRNGTKWELLEINYGDDFPFYFGIIYKQLSDGSNILFAGGKLSKKNTENSEKCYIFNPTDNIVQVSTLTLPQQDEFDGRLFVPLNEENKLFIQFSSIFPNKLYIYNSETNLFDIKELGK